MSQNANTGADTRSSSLLDAAEARRAEAGRFAWTVPSLALAAQAFLLTIALDPASTPWRRAVAAIAGLVTVLAAGQFMGKQVFLFDMYEAVVERERLRLDLPRLSREHLLADIDSFPADTSLRQRQWREEPRGRWQLVKRARNWFVDQRSVAVWSTALAIFAVIDVGIFAWSFACLCN